MTDKVVVSTSFGKDSTAMLHLMLERGEQIDEVMFFETGWDFPQMEAHIQQVIVNTGIRVVHIRHYRHLNELLYRWGWPHKSGGWCVGCKRDDCNKFVRAVKGTVECIGFNTDEVHRTRRSGLERKKGWKVRFPLIEYGFSGADALSYCRDLGYTWGGLYDIFDRVSCFCCPKAGVGRIEKLRTYFPELYNRYLEMDKIAREWGMMK